MKNREYLYRCIIPGMDIALLTTTSDIEQLRAMALAMVQKVVAEKNAELRAKDQRISLLEEALLLARQQRFGKKCETLTSMQRSLFEEDVDADIAAIEANLKAQLPRNADEKKSPSSRPVRKPLPANLERVTRVIEPESTDCCPCCQGELRHFRDEISEKLEYIPAKFVVNQYIRPQYNCPACEKVFTGRMPPQIIPKGMAESSLVAQVVVSKYRDYQPLYRQQHIFARADIELPVSTMAGWVGAAGAALAPLAALLHQTLLTRPVIHADETTLQILDTRKGGTAKRGYLWSYVSGEKTGDAVVCFECLPGRGSQYPMSFLSGWSGHLVTDDYAAYKATAKQNPGIINAGCWSHVRRRFADLYKASHDPRAGMALKMMSHLFRLEKKISHRPPEKIRLWRRRYIKPLLDQLHTWLTEQEKACPPGGALHKAISYPLKKETWPTLVQILANGSIPVHNNRAERTIRPVAMGRKSWLFAGSQAAGTRAAQIMSLLETAKMNGLEPHAWLTDVLSRLPSWPEERQHELLPLNGFTFSVPECVSGDDTCVIN